jgi:hypothetical protein
MLFGRPEEEMMKQEDGKSLRTAVYDRDGRQSAPQARREPKRCWED